MRTSVLAVLAPVLLVWLGGCLGAMDETCEYWLHQFEQRKQERKAIQEIGHLRCKEALGALKDRFPDTMYRREAITTLKELFPPERLAEKGEQPPDDAVEIVRSALKDREVGPIAIRLAIDWKVKSVKDDVAELVRSQKSAANRDQALEAMIELSSPLESIETLIWAVGENPNLQGVDTNIFSAKQLEEIDWMALAKKVDGDPECQAANSQKMEDRPEKCTQAARATNNLIKALFMVDAKQNSAQYEARMALRAIGPSATDMLLRSFKGLNKDLNDFAMSANIPQWRYTQGLELVEMLWDVGDRRATPHLMEAIGIALDPPPPDVARSPEPRNCGPDYAANPWCQWRNTNNNRLATTALTVGALANDEAVQFAVALLGRKNPPPDATQFVNAGLGLALMGTEASREAMWKLFSGEDEAAAEKRRKIAEIKEQVDSKKLPKEKEKELKGEHDVLIDDLTALAARKANYITNLVVGLSPSHVATYKRDVMEIATKESEGYLKGEIKPIQESAEQALPLAYFNVVDRCVQNAKCYAQILKDAKGKLAGFPKEIEAAARALEETRKAIKEELKSSGLSEKIRLKRKEIQDGRDALSKLREEFDALAQDKVALKDKKNVDRYNELVELFNKGIDEDKARMEGLDKLYDESDKIYAKDKESKDLLTQKQAKLHEIEKAILMLGTYPGDAAKSVELICETFKEAKLSSFTQLRQWATVTLEHIAKKRDAKVLGALLDSEYGDKAKEERKARHETFWTLRLQSLIQRVERMEE